MEVWGHGCAAVFAPLKTLSAVKGTCGRTQTCRSTNTLANNFMIVHDSFEPGGLETRTFAGSGLYSVQ